MINGYTHLAVTKLDVLDKLSEIKIAVAYTLNGKTLESMPASMCVLDRVLVEYITFPGWMTDIGCCRKFEDLPENARTYLNFIADFLKIPSMF